MSIWCTWESVGYDSWDIMGGKKRPRKVRGQVRSYAVGWSNHYPTSRVERPASVSIASIPEWCVPGHDESDDYDVTGPWVRLDVEAPTWKEAGVSDGGVSYLAVVLDEEAARALCDDLTRWLDQPKAHPRKASKP